MTVVDGIAFKSLWVIGRHLPSFFLRLYFTRERLASLVYIDIRARHDSVSIDLSPNAAATIYLQVINLCPLRWSLIGLNFTCFLAVGR